MLYATYLKSTSNAYIERRKEKKEQKTPKANEEEKQVAVSFRLEFNAFS